MRSPSSHDNDDDDDDYDYGDEVDNDVHLTQNNPYNDGRFTSRHHRTLINSVCPKEADNSYNNDDDD